MAESGQTATGEAHETRPYWNLPHLLRASAQVESCVALPVRKECGHLFWSLLDGRALCDPSNAVTCLTMGGRIAGLRKMSGSNEFVQVQASLDVTSVTTTCDSSERSCTVFFFTSTGGESSCTNHQFGSMHPGQFEGKW